MNQRPKNVINQSVCKLSLLGLPNGHLTNLMAGNEYFKREQPVTRSKQNTLLKYHPSTFITKLQRGKEDKIMTPLSYDLSVDGLYKLTSNF